MEGHARRSQRRHGGLGPRWRLEPKCVSSPTSVARMARFGGRSSSLKFARAIPEAEDKRFERTVSNRRERRLHLPCRRSWVRVPSSAPKTPVNLGFCFEKRQRESPMSPRKWTQNYVFPCGPLSVLCERIRLATSNPDAPAAVGSTTSLPWRFRGVTRVHARSCAAQFLLQIGLNEAPTMRREWSRVSFLMCPFCVRAWLLALTTPPAPQVARMATGRARLIEPPVVCVSFYVRRGSGGRDAKKRSTVSSGSMLRCARARMRAPSSAAISTVACVSASACGAPNLV
jgi:hypothetical protein